MMRVPHELFKFTATVENRRGSHGERIGDSSRREPWAFFLTTQSPRLPGKKRSAWLPKPDFHKRGAAVSAVGGCPVVKPFLSNRNTSHDSIPVVLSGRSAD